MRRLAQIVMTAVFSISIFLLGAFIVGAAERWIGPFQAGQVSVFTTLGWYIGTVWCWKTWG